VLSFRYDAIPGEPAGYSGELVINAQLAAEEGAQRPTSGGRAWGPPYELALYLAHGCDHLVGYDDGDAAGSRRMRRRELTWLKTDEIRGLVEGLVIP